MLEIRSLRKTFDGPGRTVEALDDITLTVAAGQFVCIVGPSGCGKTTLLRCLGGLLPPTSGEIRVGGDPVAGPPDGLAIVFQEYGRSLFPWLRVGANVELPLRSKGIGRAERRRIVAGSLAAVGLSDAGDAYPWQLSGGMQQRVAIARAIAFEPRVLLMDEPFAAVDAQTRGDLEDLVRRVWRQFGMTLLFVTHDIDESVYLGDRVVVLSASPTRVLDSVEVDLPGERDQLETRSAARFVELRSHVLARIREATRASAGPGQPSVGPAALTVGTPRRRSVPAPRPPRGSRRPE
jgi:NitT/TauT family transport system ATP-binding protein